MLRGAVRRKRHRALLAHLLHHELNAAQKRRLAQVNPHLFQHRQKLADKAACIVRVHELHALQRLVFQPLLLRQRMIPRHHDIHRLAIQRHRPQPADHAGARGVEKADIQHIRADQRRNARVVRHHHVQPGFGVRGVELLKQREQAVADVDFAPADADRALQLLRRADAVQRQIIVLHHAVGMHQKRLALPGERELAARFAEKRRADLLLQHLDMLKKRARRILKLLRRLLIVERLGERNHGQKLFDIHGRNVLFRSMVHDSLIICLYTFYPPAPQIATIKCRKVSRVSFFASAEVRKASKKRTCVRSPHVRSYFDNH